MLYFGLLGPVVAERDGDALRLRGPKQRAMLAMFLLSANQVVSRDRLTEGLWGSRLPEGIDHALDAQVSMLRRTLSAAGAPALRRQAPGYLLGVDPESLDITRFDRLVDEGRVLRALGQPQEAARVLRQALELWRGPALSDVRAAPFASGAALGLEERRTDALEERIEADLDGGQGSELVAELERLVAAHPMRERLLSALALALYRAGQQSRALDALSSARHRLAQELGIDPGLSVRELERRILRHDPALLPHTRSSATVAPETTATAAGTPARDHTPCAATSPSVGTRNTSKPATSTRVRRWHRRWLIAGTVAPALVGGLVILGSSDPGAYRADPVVQGGPALVGVDAVRGTVLRPIRLPGLVAAAASGGAGLWVVQPSAARVTQLDPATGHTLAQVPVPGGPGNLAIGGGAVWVSTVSNGTVVRIDQRSKAVTQVIAVGGVPSGIAFGWDRVWVVDQNGRRLLRIQPATGRVERSLTLQDRPSDVIEAGGTVWVASHDADTVTAVDARSMSPVTTLRVGGGPTALAAGAGRVWVANGLDATVSRIAPREARVDATFPVDGDPTALDYAAGAIWVASEDTGTLARLDPENGSVTHEFHLGARPTAMAAGHGKLWVDTRPTQDRRGGTLTLVATAPPPTVDPGYQVQMLPPQFLGLAYDGLVTFQHDHGAPGLRLVPDLALALPTPSAAATTYTFRLRPGIRYSTGEPVRASDFPRALLRIFRGRSSVAEYFTGLVGAGQCLQRPASCQLNRGVSADDTLRTVTYRLSAPDPDFLFRLALNNLAPVPPGTPTYDTGLTPVPGTGPYRIVHADDREIRFARNSNFHEWSHAAQPAGNPERIVWRFGLSRAAQVRAVISGQADWAFEGIPPELWSQVNNEHPSSVHLNAMPQTDLLLVDTRRPPFDDVRVRRALNLAIDRQAATRIYGPNQATPTCQVLPPGVTGRLPYCPYTRDPQRGAHWTAPDLARARQLVAASGTRASQVTVGEISDSDYPPPDVARVAARALSQIGYHVRLRITSRAAYLRLPAAERDSPQVVMSAWYADFPSPATFFEAVVSCHGPISARRICDPALDRAMVLARGADATDPEGSAARWSAVDRRAVDQALTVPIANPRSVEVTSPRLRGYQYNPLWGFLADQAWLR